MPTAYYYDNTSTATDTGTWTNWATTTATTSTNETWTLWVEPRPQPVSAAQQREQRERQATATREREAARVRAEKLLTQNLSKEQRADYKRLQEFRVIVPSGKSYLVRRGRAGNVYLLDEKGQRTRRYCAHPVERVPDEDTMLAQKLLLETDERAFLEMANASAA